MKTQNDIGRKNIREQRRLNRIRNENINIDISNFFENEIIRNEKQKNKSKNEIDISNFFKDEIFREQRRLKKITN